MTITARSTPHAIRGSELRECPRIKLLQPDDSVTVSFRLLSAAMVCFSSSCSRGPKDRACCGDRARMAHVAWCWARTCDTRPLRLDAPSACFLQGALLHSIQCSTLAQGRCEMKPCAGAHAASVRCAWGPEPSHTTVLGSLDCAARALKYCRIVTSR